MATLKKGTKSDNRNLIQKKEKLAVIICMLLTPVVILAVLCLPLSYMNPTLIGSALVFSWVEFRLYQNWGMNSERCFFPQGISIGRMGVSAVLTLLFLGMLSIKELWGIRQAFNSKTLFAGYLLLLFLASFYLIDDLLARYVTDKKFIDKKVEKQAEHLYITIGSVRIYRLLWIFLLAVICVLAANYPWRPSPDAETVYRYVINKDWNDWHPIGYLLFVRMCMQLLTPGGQHPFSVLLVQSALWLLLMNYAMDRIYSWTHSVRAVYRFAALNLILFTPVLYLGLMYKDVLYSMCMMGVSMELFHILYMRKVRWSSLGILTLFSCGVALFRHMGAEMVTLILAVFFVYFLVTKRNGWKRLGILMLLPAMCFTLVSTVYGTHILHMKKSPTYITYTMPISIVGDFALHQPEIFTPEEKAFLEKIMPLEDWAQGYQNDPYWVDMLARSYGVPGNRIERVDSEYGHQLIRLNAALLLRNPKEYICALLRPTSVIWQIFRPADGYEWTIAGYYKPSDRPDLIESNLVSSEKILSQLMGSVQYALMENPLLSAFYSRGGIWCFALFFLSAVLLLRRQREYLFVFLLPFLNTALMMLSCPAQDPRYILPVMETAFVFLPMLYDFRTGNSDEAVVEIGASEAGKRTYTEKR